MTSRLRRLAVALLALEVAGIAWLVLNPSSATPSEAVVRVSRLASSLGAPGWAASTTGWEYALNALLFLPFGLLAALVWEHVALELWVVVGFGVSAALELVQLLALDARSPTLSDISANTIGTFLGATLAMPVLYCLDRRRRRAHDTAELRWAGVR